MLSSDYYDILEVSRSAKDAEIQEAFRRKALRYHPDKCKDAFAAQIFNDVAEAYQILNNRHYRALYDQHGRRGLGRAQWIDKNHCGEPPYDEDPKFESVDLKLPGVVFEEFFANTNPFSAELANDAPIDESKIKQTQPPVQKTFYCTLEEINTGCEKIMTIFRKTPDGNEESRTLHIFVQRGWSEGFKVEFKATGNETKHLLPADIIYTMCECPHPRFQRDGDNLIYKYDISLKEALCGSTIHILTLDQRLLSIPTNYVIKPNTIHKVKGEGLPILNTENRGDLLIYFNIIFPDEINEHTKQKILELNL